MKIIIEAEKMDEPIRRNRRPLHPGRILAGILRDINMTQGEIAKKLDVSRRTISLIINGHQPVTVDMAIRLGKFCGNGPDIWLNMQLDVDMWDAMHKNRRVYQRIKPIGKEAA